MIYRRIISRALLTASLLSADTLLLRNGSTINGKFAGGDDRVIRFAVGSQVNTYDLSDVDSLKLSPSYSSRSGGFTPAAPPPPPPAAPSDSYNAPPAPVSSNQMEIPAGTQLVVRLIDGADSDRDSLGKTYRASVEQPVVLNGQTVIPRGADAVAVLNDAQQSGKIEGKTILTLALRSVTVNGRTYDLATSNVTKASGSRGVKSGEVIGGTAVLGTIIGAIAGGGKGAAIGGLAGAGAGTAVQVATSGQKVKVPSETVLTFTLQNPLDL
jgi:hypothetical protein